MKNAVDSLLLLVLAAPLAACADMPPRAPEAPHSIAPHPVGGAMPITGGYNPAPVNDASVLAAADYAIKVQAYRLKEQGGGASSRIALLSIVAAERQVVSGMNYRLRLKVVQNGKERNALAEVYQPLRGPDPFSLKNWTWIDPEMTPAQPEQLPVAGGYSNMPVSDSTVRAAAEIALQGETYYLKHQPGGEASRLALVAITRAEQQVVAGMNYRLQLRVNHDGREREAEAVVYKRLSSANMTLTSWTWR